MHLESAYFIGDAYKEMAKNICNAQCSCHWTVTLVTPLPKFGFLLKNVIAFFCTFMRSGESALRIVDKLLHHGSNIIYVLREDGVNFGWVIALFVLDGRAQTLVFWLNLFGSTRLLKHYCQFSEPTCLFFRSLSARIIQDWEKRNDLIMPWH